MNVVNKVVVKVLYNNLFKWMLRKSVDEVVMKFYIKIVVMKLRWSCDEVLYQNCCDEVLYQNCCDEVAMKLWWKFCESMLR